MKRRPKKAMGTAACATLAAVMLLTMGAWSAFAGGLLATGKTVAENEAVWGKPVAIQTFSDGTEKRFYKINNTMNCHRLCKTVPRTITKSVPPGG